jgi:hypothetical protein
MDMSTPKPTQEIVLELLAGADGAVSFVEVPAETQASVPEAEAEPQPIEREANAAIPERLELVAEKEIVLRVGDASITLTRAGKIILRGTYVLSRSSGVNKIKGGSVQIN